MFRVRWLAALYFLLVVFMTVTPSSAEIIAEFVGGGSNLEPVTDVVDAFVGKAGDGWTEEWSMDFNSTLNLAITTDGANPPGTGNYLDLTAGATGSSQGVGIGRSFTAGMDVSVSHSIDFKYRINEDLGASGTFTHYNDRYQLFDVGYDRKTANGDCSWVIGCYGAGGTTWLDAEDAKYWVVYDGDNDTGSFVADRQVNSSILVQTGVTYDFHIDVDAATKTWDVTIGTGGTTLYDSTVLHPDGLGWRTNAATVAGRLGFGCYTSASTDTRAYSLDGIRIVPEPSALLLMLSSVLFLRVSARRSR